MPRLDTQPTPSRTSNAPAARPERSPARGYDLGGMLYFAYGSNLSSARLRARVGEVGLRGRALLPLHEHAFSKLGHDGTAKGTIRPHPRRGVHGVLYELSPPQLRRLFTFEGGYRDTELRVLCPDGTSLRALTFIALLPGPTPPPTPEYLDHYRQGFVEHDLPRAYALALLRDAGDERPLPCPAPDPSR